MPDHSEIYKWWEDPKRIIGAIITVGGLIKAWRYRKRSVDLSAPAEVATEEADRVSRLEIRYREQHRILMETRTELQEVSIRLDSVSGEVTQLRMSNRDDRRQVKEALIVVNDEMARIHGRVHQIVRRLDESTLEDGQQP